jgi:hypothetical protein
MRHTPLPAKRTLALAALAASQLFSLSAHAAATDSECIAELEQKLTRSMALIEQLSTRLSQLEGGKAVPAAHDGSAKKMASQGARIEQLEKSLD